MDHRKHYVSGFFATREAALEARNALMVRGLPKDQLQLFATDATATAPASKGDSDAVLKDVFVDGTIGTVVGTGIGALAEVALVAANVSLFVASPLLAPLVMMGWGASVGALVGATVGATAQEKTVPAGEEGWLSALVTDAIATGQVVLVATTHTDAQTATARQLIEASVGDCKDELATPRSTA
nr:hypothetical protein [uncultured Albidiferax sp.]